MTTGTNFWDAGVWSFVINLTLLLAAMMAATILRNLIRPLRQMLIPSAVLGGFLLLLVNFLVNLLTGHSLVNPSTLEALTYHGLGLGFVAMSLRTLEKQKDLGRRSDSFDAGLTVVGSYLIQAFFGLAITIGCYYLLDSFWASGILLPLGYGQGPGQAYNWGHTYELTYGFTGGTSFGLTLAAMGFVSASIGGVVYLNVLRRRGIVAGELGRNVQDESLNAASITGGNEIPLSESLDKMTVQIALVCLAYVLAYGFMSLINVVIEAGWLGNFGFNTVRPLIWGFNFLFGVLAALLLKALLRSLMKKGVIRRQYCNDFMQNRLAGFFFDIMVVASIAAINLSAFRQKEFVIPLILLCVVGAVITFFYLRFVTDRIYPDYRHEAFLSLYGTMTGTASTGVILLREIDPAFLTPASNNLVYHQPWAILFGFPMLLLLAVAPQSLGKGYLTLVILAALFLFINVLLFRREIFKRKKKA